MYRSPAVSPPTLDELQSLAARHHLHVSNDDMEQIRGTVLDDGVGNTRHLN